MNKFCLLFFAFSCFAGDYVKYIAYSPTESIYCAVYTIDAWPEYFDGIDIIIIKNNNYMIGNSRAKKYYKVGTDNLIIYSGNYLRPILNNLYYEMENKKTFTNR